jgi:hypothetical protein
MIDNRICDDYKKILDLLDKEEPALAYTLGKKMVKNKLNWWPLRSFETRKENGKNLFERIHLLQLDNC